MHHYKIIILCPQCSGKTTLKKYLESKHPDLHVVEEDQMSKDLNGGTYPSDLEHKENVLRPQIEQYLEGIDKVIFLSSYYREEALDELKRRDFKVLQLVLTRDEFEKRNARRMDADGTNDARQWADDLFDFHQRIHREGKVDKTLDATQPVEKIAEVVIPMLT